MFNLIKKNLSLIILISKLILLLNVSIYDSDYHIIVNGSLEGLFGSSNGLHQGCPLSPYFSNYFLYCYVISFLLQMSSLRRLKASTIDFYIVLVT